MGLRKLLNYFLKSFSEEDNSNVKYNIEKGKLLTSVASKRRRDQNNTAR